MGNGLCWQDPSVLGNITLSSEDHTPSPEPVHTHAPLPPPPFLHPSSLMTESVVCVTVIGSRSFTVLEGCVLLASYFPNTLLQVFGIYTFSYATLVVTFRRSLHAPFPTDQDILPLTSLWYSY